MKILDKLKSIRPFERPFWYNSNIDDLGLVILLNIKRNIFTNKKLDEILSKSAAKDYQKYFVKELNQKCKIKGKTIYEIGSDVDLETAKLMLAYGAKHIVCINPVFPDNLKSPDKRITLIKDLGEKVNTKNKKFDIVFGIALLEHVYDIKALFEKARDIVKNGGYIYFSGNPFYCCSCGHHTYIKNENGKPDYMFDGRTGSINPFEPWEHLIYETKEEYRECLLKKGFFEKDANSIAEQLFCGHITKYRTNDIIKTIKSVEGLEAEFQFNKEFEYVPNEFFKKALEKYTEEELLTRGITVCARKIKSK